jgi:hypothetical protein
MAIIKRAGRMPASWRGRQMHGTGGGWRLAVLQGNALRRDAKPGFLRRSAAPRGRRKG